MEAVLLPEPLRRSLSQLSQTVFSPGGEKELGCWIGQESSTSLTLQMCLYFNLYYFPFWWLSEVIMLEVKYHVLSTYYCIILCMIIFLISLVEFIRIYLGYVGNLQQKVPELAGFWLLTLLLQMPMTLFATCNPRLLVLPLEYGVNIIYLIMLGAEVVLAFTTLRRMALQLELRFHMTHFDSLEESRYARPTSSKQLTDTVMGQMD